MSRNYNKILHDESARFLNFLNDRLASKNQF